MDGPLLCAFCQPLLDSVELVARQVLRIHGEEKERKKESEKHSEKTINRQKKPEARQKTQRRRKGKQIAILYTYAQNTNRREQSLCLVLDMLQTFL